MPLLFISLLFSHLSIHLSILTKALDVSEYVSVCERVDAYFISPCCVLYVRYVSQTAGTPGSHCSALMKLGGKLYYRQYTLPRSNLFTYSVFYCDMLLILNCLKVFNVNTSFRIGATCELGGSHFCLFSQRLHGLPPGPPVSSHSPSSTLNNSYRRQPITLKEDIYV